jgi:hypothetical protein
MAKLVVLAITLAACGQGAQRAPNANADTPENQAMLAKLKGYSECLDEHAERVFDLADAYRAHGQLEVPSEPKKCLDKIADGKKLEPHVPELEAAGDAFGTALTEVAAAMGEAHADRAKVATLHPRILAALDAFDAAQGALFDQVYQLNRTVHADRLAHREKREGRSLSVIADDAMMRAEDAMRGGAIGADHLDKLDLAVLTARLDKFEAGFEEMQAYALAHPKELGDNAKAFHGLVENGRSYLVAGRQLVIRARDHVPYTDAEKMMIAANNERSVIGTPAAMVNAYNLLVDFYDVL